MFLSLHCSHVDEVKEERSLGELGGRSRQKVLKKDAGNVRRKKNFILLSFAKNWLWAPAFIVEAKKNIIQLYNFK